MIFYADTGAPHSCIEDNELKRIIRHSERRTISVIDSERDFKFGDTLLRSRGIVELTLPTPGSALDIPVIIHV